MTAHASDLGCYAKIGHANRTCFASRNGHGVYVAWKEDGMASPQPAVTTTTPPSPTTLSTQSRAQDALSSSSDGVSETKSPAITTEDDIAHSKGIEVHESRSTTVSNIESVPSPTHDPQSKLITPTPPVATSVSLRRLLRPGSNKRRACRQGSSPALLLAA